MYKLKTFAQRSMMLGAAAMLVTASLPPVQVFAYNELNPLTERSLLLSSSAPGYVDTDGSGNSYGGGGNAIGENYAPAGSGPNGKKTGQTFSFKVSTDSVATDRPIRAFTFQYCTQAAGLCQAPGNNLGDARVAEGEGAREDNATAHASRERSDLNVNYTNAVQGVDFDVYLGDSETPVNPAESAWTMTADNAEDPEHTGSLTGKNNLITLTSPTGVSPVFNQKVRVVFRASETNYITNPGNGSFFVKINTFDSDTVQDLETTRIDGGVTVANMMTDSIHITTKVLETMQFSVGIALPEQADDPGVDGYGICDPISVVNNNRINLGNENAEWSLETDRAHEQKSYWRVTSNSSGGATIYYSGDTLRNTVGDHIAPISPAGSKSITGREQFGLALVSAEADVHENFANAIDSESNSLQLPTLDPLSGVSVDGEGPYSTGDGAYNSAGNGSARSDKDEEGNWLKDDGNPVRGSVEDHPEDYATFAFNVDSQLVPEPIAQGTEVLSCTTGKMRYVGNIAADTPAGVYTTKINYLAAPQY